ncbi:MAG: family 78 glycoside hydrolase catalytic domain [Fibrobacteres bacterium]|nr:family 78 glycoside hydrolase catalytic domain [Fibrobacterota bacterium]
MKMSSEKTCCPIELLCEFRQNPIHIDEKHPRLSWKIKDPRNNAKQTAYQIAAATSLSALKYNPDLWDTGKIKSSDSFDIEYAGKPLASRMTVYWKVKVWDLNGAESVWSETAKFETAFLKTSDWKAEWIGLKQKENEPLPCFKREFTLKDNPVKAKLYITAQGLFEASLNGRRVGEDYFTPGWTDYNKRIHYMVYDVTDLLYAGKNAADVMLGNGWFSGRLGWAKQRNCYGKQLSLLCQLEVTYKDNSTETIVSDSSWKGCSGPLIESDFYDGESYDANREIGKGTKWKQVSVFPPPKAIIMAKPNIGVQRQEELTAVKITEPAKGVYIFDLDQNMVGWARLRIRGNRKNDKITIRFGEMLNADGTLYTINMRSAKVTDTYICRSSEETVWEPKFTFHGFRYIEISGLRKKPGKGDVTGVVLHSGMPSTGKFECSDPAVNRLQQNILWGQKGNFLEAPTDCPQRDERLGWTGDAQVFARTACFNRDVASFFEKWGSDIDDARFPDGAIPHVVPDVLRKKDGTQDPNAGAAAWADAAVICPWTVYLCYADKRILERSYETMKGFVEWRVKTSKNFIHSRACFGDWLAIDMEGSECGRTPTPRDLIATAYFARTAEIVAKAAEIIGKSADAKRFTSLHNKIREAFNREFVAPSGLLVGDTQTSYLLALGFNLLSGRAKERAVERLVSNLEKRNWHLSTGFVGTPLLAPVLSAVGRSDISYKLLLQNTYPSWLYTVANGATTMWERWNSWTKEKGFGDASMNSFNHYAYGAIGEWMYATVAGLDLDPEIPGYKHLLLHPTPGEGLTHAFAELKTRHGTAFSGWKITGNKITYKFTIPANTYATILLPGEKAIERGAGEYTFTKSFNRR